MEFCNNNDLQLIIRAHECVMDGFERFAQGHLITLFSATNYCGKDPSLACIVVSLDVLSSNFLLVHIQELQIMQGQSWFWEEILWSFQN